MLRQCSRTLNDDDHDVHHKKEKRVVTRDEQHHNFESLFLKYVIYVLQVFSRSFV